MSPPHRIGLLSISAWLLPALLPVTARSETYLRAEVDNSGQLQVVTSSRRTLRPRKIPDQVGFSQPEIAPRRRTIGWLTLHPNFTSYPVPLVLVLYRDGRAFRTFRGDGTPIWKWEFQGHGKRVAYSQQPTHGPFHPHCELKDVGTGRLLGIYDGQPTNAAPRWVRHLDRRQ